MIRSWEAVKARINHCRRCETDHVRHLVVPAGHKRHPPCSPPRPTRLLFVSVAPPWGGSYFWDETQADTLRAGLFAALTKAGYPVATPDEFCEQGFFMVPGVKCPSCHNGKDARPSAGAVANCAPFLREQCAIIAPERILALGQAAMDSLAGAFGLRITGTLGKDRTHPWRVMLAGRHVPVSGTYFAGTRRHRKFGDIIADIRNMLEGEGWGKL